MKKEKRERNEEYAKKFRKNREKQRRNTAQLNLCGIPGHDDCLFNDCPDWK